MDGDGGSTGWREDLASGALTYWNQRCAQTERQVWVPRHRERRLKHEVTA